jgi:hypothetical protein
MRRDLPVIGGVVVVILLVSFLTGSTAAKRSTGAVGTAPVTARTLACPVVNGQPRNTVGTAVVADLSGALSSTTPVSGTVTSTVLLGGSSKTSVMHLSPTADVTAPKLKSEGVSFSTSGTLAADVVADELVETDDGRYRALAGGNCLAPATDWWFAGGNGKVGSTDRVFIANPSKTPAEVGITAWTPKGVVSTPRIAAIPVPPESKVRVGVFAFAPDIPIVALHVHANNGAVTAVLLDRRTNGLQAEGGDLVPPTLPPSRSQVIEGFAAGSGPRDLVVANPGYTDAQVSVKVVTTDGEYTPSSLQPFVVRAGRASLIDVSKALSGATGAILLSSDQPVIAEGRSTAAPGGRLRPEFFWIGATNPLAGPAGVAIGREPDGGACLLLLSAPKEAASVRVTTPTGGNKVITVPAGHSTVVDITDTIKAKSGWWPFVVTPIGSAPVYGVRVLHFDGAHGAMNTAEPLIPLPSPIPLPPVREDPRLATH